MIIQLRDIDENDDLGTYELPDHVTVEEINAAVALRGDEIYWTKVEVTAKLDNIEDLIEIIEYPQGVEHSQD